MILKKQIVGLLCLVLFHACADYQTAKKNEIQDKKYFSSYGFALIYDETQYNNKIVNKKINNDILSTMHRFLKRNTLIKIINPSNSKFVETKITKKADYPKIFNIVINAEIASILELNLDNPYVEILEIKRNKTFIAKEREIFDEEKNVAEKAPVDEIKMDDLSNETNLNKNIKNKKNNFTLIIGDFYYEKSAINLRNELLKNIQTNKFFINKINNSNFRLGIGPFKNFKALKSIYISLNNLGFEDLNILRN